MSDTRANDNAKNDGEGPAASRAAQAEASARELGGGAAMTAANPDNDADAADASAPPAAGDAPQTADAEDLAERLAAAEAEIAELKDKHLRALAETENLRRRAARERDDAGKYAVTAFARDMLAVADNLQRALAAVDPATRETDPALEALVAGVEMTDKALLAAFARHGVTPIDAEGESFDPNVHEAMFELPNDAVPHGTVVQVLERGYRIHDRPLRPARVGVSRGGPKPSAEAASTPQTSEAAVEGATAGAVDKEV